MSFISVHDTFIPMQLNPGRRAHFHEGSKCSICLDIHVYGILKVHTYGAYIATYILLFTAAYYQLAMLYVYFIA